MLVTWTNWIGTTIAFIHRFSKAVFPSSQMLSSFSSNARMYSQDGSMRISFPARARRSIRRPIVAAPRSASGSSFKSSS